jgi:hypothetical protein
MVTIHIDAVDQPWEQHELRMADVIDAETEAGAIAALPAFWISGPKGTTPGTPAGGIRGVYVRLDPKNPEHIRRLQTAVTRAKAR